MLDRKMEARLAVEVADDFSAAGGDYAKLSAAVEEWIAHGKLAVAPATALSCMQHYADLIAEYFSAKSGGGFPGDAELEVLGEDFKNDFIALFVNEPAKDHARGVYDVHVYTERIFGALKAYGVLSAANRKKAEYDENSRKNLMDRARRDNTLQLTFDVGSNMISPMERYFRARSRSEAAPAVEQQAVCIPDELCRSCDAKTAALIVYLYYMYRPDRPAEGRYTDYYPVQLAETGIFLHERNQKNIVSNMLREQLRVRSSDQKNPGIIVLEDDAAADDQDIPAGADDADVDAADAEAAGEKISFRDDKRYLSFTEIYFSRNSRDRKVMAALSSECVGLFKGNGAKFTVSGMDKDLRAVLNAIQTRQQVIMAKNTDLMEMYLKYEDLEVPESRKADLIGQLSTTLIDECTADIFRNESGKQLKRIEKLSSKVVLKLMLTAYRLNEYNAGGELSDADLPDMPVKVPVTCDRLQALLTEDVLPLLNRAKHLMCSATRRITIDRSDDKKEFSFRIYASGERVKPAEHEKQPGEMTDRELMEAFLTDKALKDTDVPEERKAGLLKELVARLEAEAAMEDFRYDSGKLLKSIRNMSAKCLLMHLLVACRLNEYNAGCELSDADLPDMPDMAEVTCGALKAILTSDGLPLLNRAKRLMACETLKLSFGRSAHKGAETDEIKFRYRIFSAVKVIGRE